METIIVVAMAQNRVIGRDNALPWASAADMAHFRKADLGRFRKMTTGFPCVMGRRTWESLPKRPLPDRPNIVVSRSAAEIPGATVLGSLAQAIRHCDGYEKVFVCGGASIYREALAVADRIELTLIRREFEGDVFFPGIDSAVWEKTGASDFDGFSFISYSRVSTTEGDAKR